MTALGTTDTGNHTQLAPGFADPVEEATGTFRHLLDGMARPGTIHGMDGPEAPPPLASGLWAVALTLIDMETSVWLDPAADNAAVRSALAFHCGCPIVDDPAMAAFALIATPKTMLPLDAFNQGVPDYPDQSTTLLLQVDRLDTAGPLELRGPGIEETARLGIDGLPDGFWNEVAANHRRYPLGVDMIFATGDAIAALPRSTAIEEGV